MACFYYQFIMAIVTSIIEPFIVAIIYYIYRNNLSILKKNNMDMDLINNTLHLTEKAIA